MIKKLQKIISSPIGYEKSKPGKSKEPLYSEKQVSEMVILIIKIAKLKVRNI